MIVTKLRARTSSVVATNEKTTDASSKENHGARDVSSLEGVMAVPPTATVLVVVRDTVVVRVATGRSIVVRTVSVLVVIVPRSNSVVVLVRVTLITTTTRVVTMAVLVIAGGPEIVTSICMLGASGAVAEAVPDFGPLEAVTPNVSPGPVTERPVIAYAPLGREVVLF